jgi:sortase A
VPESLPVPADVPNENAVEPHVVLGSIEIPRLHVSKQLLEGVTLGVLDEAPGHWPGTAMPGHLGNVVVAGHRTVFDHPFHDIDQLRKGDEVVFTTSEGRFLYRVTGTEIVAPDAMRIIDQTRDHTATLFACHPLGSTRERIVVHLALA